MDATDKEHVEQCRNGHPDDYRCLVDRYQGPVFAYLARAMNLRFALRAGVAQRKLPMEVKHVIELLDKLY